MKTGSIKFDSVPQRLNMALTISLLITCAASLQNLMVAPDVASGGTASLAYPNLEQRVLYLVFLALWGLKIFVDDNQCLVPGKAIPAVDVLFLIFCHGALISAAALVTKSTLAVYAILYHFLGLALWNFIALAIKGRSGDIVKWLVFDSVVSAILVALWQRGELTLSNWWIIAGLFVVLVIDTIFSHTLKTDYLIGKEVDLG